MRNVFAIGFQHSSSKVSPHENLHFSLKWWYVNSKEEEKDQSVSNSVSLALLKNGWTSYVRVSLKWKLCQIDRVHLSFVPCIAIIFLYKNVYVFHWRRVTKKLTLAIACWKIGTFHGIFMTNYEFEIISCVKTVNCKQSSNFLKLHF